MKLCVFGLWHLGSVTAACMADLGFDVIAIDDNKQNVDSLNDDRSPVLEAGLNELIEKGRQSKKLTFSTNFSDVSGAEAIWVTYDTPVDDDDVADTDFVKSRILELLKHASDNCLVILSSQVPVGFTRTLANECTKLFPSKNFRFAYSPENLRLGKAIQVFTQPDRIVVGCDEQDRETFCAIFNEISSNLCCMKIESAEMTKHALNAFLGASVTFINEVATICELVGADAKEVAQGLKSEERIGPKAYLGPGGAFSGGTLARDVAFLGALAADNQVSVPLLASIRPSNEHHKLWAARRLTAELGKVKGETIAVLGLTYKPGTDTLRRSAAVELCTWLSNNGAKVVAHDPSIKTVPAEVSQHLELADSYESALKGASAAVLCTEWPEYKNIKSDEVLKLMRNPLILDANGFLKNSFSKSSAKYVSVGQPSRKEERLVRK